MRMKLAVMIMFAGIAAVALGHQFTPAPMDEGSAHVYTGIVRDINVENRTVVVTAAANDTKFFVAPDATIIVKDKSDGRLADIKPAQGVEVHYTEETYGFLAHQISQTGLK